MMINKEILEERERVVNECYKTIEHILKDKREGKLKNKSYPIKKISLILFHLYGIGYKDIDEEMRKRGF